MTRYSDPEENRLARKLEFHKSRRRLNAEKLLEPNLKPKTKGWCDKEIEYQTVVIEGLKRQLTVLRDAKKSGQIDEMRKRG